MKKGEWTTIKVEGESIRAQFLGVGHYSQAFKVGDLVYLFTQNDYMKEALRLAGKDTHLPEVKYVETIYKGGRQIEVNTMEYSRDITRNDKEAWAILKELNSVRGNMIAVVASQPKKHNTSWTDEAHVVMRETIDNADVPQSVKDSLDRLYAWATSYGTTICFEFAPRNIGVDGAGNIIFRDVLYDAEKR